MFWATFWATFFPNRRVALVGSCAESCLRAFFLLQIGLVVVRVFGCGDDDDCRRTNLCIRIEFAYLLSDYMYTYAVKSGAARFFLVQSTDAMIFKYFRRKIQQKIWRF
jgi:hypothetical protein